MKKTILASVLALTATTAFADDFDYSSTATSSEWEIGGTIAERCIVSTYDGGERSTTLDLANASAQTTASVSLWCNTHSAKAKTTYSSKNGGKMLNGDNDEIEYTIDISGTATGLDLASAQTVDQLTGHGTKVGAQTRSVKVAPKLTGREYAGTYRDTIYVEVAAN